MEHVSASSAHVRCYDVLRVMEPFASFSAHGASNHACCRVKCQVFCGLMRGWTATRAHVHHISNTGFGWVPFLSPLM